MYNQISKIAQKIISTFRENVKNRQNHRSFEVAVIGGKQFSKIYFYHSETFSDLYS